MESEAQKSFMHRSVVYQELGNIKSRWLTAYSTLFYSAVFVPIYFRVVSLNERYSYYTREEYILKNGLGSFTWDIRHFSHAS